MWLRCSHIPERGRIVSKKAGIRELKNQTSRIVSEVREEMAEYVITSQGRPVAMLRPFTGEDEESIRQLEAEQALAEMKSLADEIGKAWKSHRGAVDLVDEQRR